MRNRQAELIVAALLDNFEEIRKQKGLSHEKLAHLAGVHRSTISLILNKKRSPTILTCLKIADALDKNLGQLIKDLS